jgi:hypothetical protein
LFGRGSYSHQEAFLIYHKKGVARKEAIEKLSPMETISKTWTGLINDMKDPNMTPILNPHNYAPFSEGTYSNPDLIAITDLHACIGMDCNIKKRENSSNLINLITICIVGIKLTKKNRNSSQYFFINTFIC